MLRSSKHVKSQALPVKIIKLSDALVSKECNENISSLSTLVEKCENLKIGEIIWSEVICYLKAVRIGGSSKNFYLNCPNCKNKFHEETGKECQKQKYRYLLSINIADDHHSIWVNAYDEAEEILALSE